MTRLTQKAVSKDSLQQNEQNLAYPPSPSPKKVTSCHQIYLIRRYIIIGTAGRVGERGGRELVLTKLSSNQSQAHHHYPVKETKREQIQKGY